jgi:Tfp pilus assembly protein FimT
MKVFNNKGITIIEILMVISTIVILTIIIVPNLSKFRNEQTLNNTVSDIVSLLNKARNDTISSLNSNNYSVHFESGRVVYFNGSVFNNGDGTNSSTTLDSSVTIPSSGGINLNGGGSDVIFTRISGDTSNYGTIIVRLTSDGTRQKTITINKTGSVSSN